MTSSLPEPIFCSRCDGYIKTGHASGLEQHRYQEDCIEALSRRLGLLEDQAREDRSHD